MNKCSGLTVEKFDLEGIFKIYFTIKGIQFHISFILVSYYS